MSFAEEILIKMGVDASKFEHDLRHIKEQVRDWAKEQTRLITGPLADLAGIEGIKTAYEQTVEYADKVMDLSHRLGISTDAIQVWDFALKKNGGTIESAAAFFEKLAASRDKALQGGTEGAAMSDHFKELGVSIDDLKNKRIEDIAEQIGEVFKAGDPQKLIGSLKEIGGKGAGDVVATLRDGIAEAREEAERLGIVISKDVLSELKEAGERASIMGEQLRAGLAPAFAWMIEQVQHFRHAFNGVFSGLYQAAARLLEASPLKSSTWKAAAESFRQAIIAEHQDEDAENAALEAKRKRDAEPLKGGATQDAHLHDHEKAAEINKQSAELEEKAKLKVKSLEEQMAYLRLRRNHLQDELNDKSKGELEHARTRNELAKVNLELAERTVEKKKEDAEAAKKIGDVHRLQRDKTEDQTEYNTIEELAKSRDWRGTGRRNTWEAQRIEFLQQDEKVARRIGNTDFANREREERLKLTKDLQDRGVIKPDHHLESIDNEIQNLRNDLIKLGVKLQDDPQ